MAKVESEAKLERMFPSSICLLLPRRCSQESGRAAAPQQCERVLRGGTLQPTEKRKMFHIPRPLGPPSVAQCCLLGLQTL